MSKIDNIRATIRNHLKEKKERSIEVQQRRNAKWLHYYKSKEWRNLREWKISKDPICENCKQYGRIVPAEEVHHRKIFGSGENEAEKWNLLLDPLNLVSLCKSCHDLFHNEMRAKNITYIEGWIEPKWKTLADM